MLCYQKKANSMARIARIGEYVFLPGDADWSRAIKFMIISRLLPSAMNAGFSSRILLTFFEFMILLQFRASYMQMTWKRILCSSNPESTKLVTVLSNSACRPACGVTRKQQTGPTACGADHFPTSPRSEGRL